MTAMIKGRNSFLSTPKTQDFGQLRPVFVLSELAFTHGNPEPVPMGSESLVGAAVDFLGGSLLFDLNLQGFRGGLGGLYGL